MSTFCDRQSHGLFGARIEEQERQAKENIFNDHRVGFGPYHRFLSSSPRQGESWLCHPSSCRGSGSSFSLEFCSSFSSLDPYRRPCHGHGRGLCRGLCHGRLFRDDGEGCEIAHGHDPTCEVGMRAYRNAKPTKEGSWPTTSDLVRGLCWQIYTKHT